MLALFVLSALWPRTAGEPLTYAIYSHGGGYVSPPIGLGPGGGRLKATITLQSTRDPFGINLVSVLSRPQLLKWQDAESPPNAIFDTSSRISTFSALFGKNFDFDLELTNEAPEQYVVTVVFPQSHPDDNDLLVPSGYMLLDWEQADAGSYLQFQYRELSKALSVSLNLLSAFVVLYVTWIYKFFKLSSRLHLIYVLVLLFTCGFLFAWVNSLDIEMATGDRTSLQSKWIPSLMEKGFDMLEVVVYLITALGWQTMRGSFTRNEIQMIVVGGFLSLVLGVFEVACGDDQTECGGYTSARMVIHMFGFLTAIVGFNYHITYLAMHIRESTIASTETGKMYNKLFQFSAFRFIFLLYIIQPTVAVVIRADVIDWFDDWIFLTFFWVTKIALICGTAVVFRPKSSKMQLVDLAIRERRRAQLRPSPTADTPPF